MAAERARETQDGAERAAADGTGPARDALKDHAHRLVASRRWARGDLELLDLLVTGGDADRDALLAGDEGRARSLRSLVALKLAAEVDGMVRMDADARALGAEVLAIQHRRKAGAASRAERGSAERERGEDVKRTVTAAILNVFPAMPADAASSVAARLAPRVAKKGTRPDFQTIVNTVAEVRLERWRQAIASDPAVSAKLVAMQARGDTGRARKRFRDQRAVEKVQDELADWRGELPPVNSPRLG